MGEFLPIVAVAIFLSAKAFLGLISLAVVAVIALLFVFVPQLIRQQNIGNHCAG